MNIVRRLPLRQLSRVHNARNTTNILANTSIRTLSASAKHIYDLSSLDSGDKTILKAREMMGIKKIPQYLLRKSSVFLYEACTDKIDVERFIKVLNLEDTFSTWFNVTKLHVWMVAARCMAEGSPNGENIRNELIARMWDDCGARVDKLGSIKAKVKQEALKNYYHEFNATLLALDEGALTDDITLAGALWRTIFGMNKNPNPEEIELMVKYVREQMEHLHTTLKSDQILFTGDINWKRFDRLVL